MEHTEKLLLSQSKVEKSKFSKLTTSLSQQEGSPILKNWVWTVQEWRLTKKGEWLWTIICRQMFLTSSQLEIVLGVQCWPIKQKRRASLWPSIFQESKHTLTTMLFPESSILILKWQVSDTLRRNLRQRVNYFLFRYLVLQRSFPIFGQLSSKSHF